MVLHDVPSPKNGKDFGYDDIEGGNLLGNLLGSLQEIFSGNKFLYTGIWNSDEFGWHLPHVAQYSNDHKFWGHFWIHWNHHAIPVTETSWPNVLPASGGSAVSTRGRESSGSRPTQPGIGPWNLGDAPPEMACECWCYFGVRFLILVIAEVGEASK